MNFYRYFIQGYSQVAAPLINLMKGSKNEKKFEPFNFSSDTVNVFNQLCEAFMSVSILIHFDPMLRIWVETDVFIVGLAGILSQLQNSEEWHPVTFWSRKLILTESQYETHDQKLLVIIMMFKHWCHYLEDSYHAVEVLTNHNNLWGFMNVKELYQR